MLSLVLGLLVLASTAFAQDATPPDKSRVRKKPPPPATIYVPTTQLPATPPPTDCAAHPTMNPDGNIVTVLPDGRTKLTRPGVCGYTMVMPDGRRSTITCQQVQVPTPPWPADDPNRVWLYAHGKNLLEVIDNLLGGDPSSLENYKRSYERPDMTAYELIVVRTDTIAKLLQPPQ